jgi:glycosyltransferase involved in cell wall biosynthesis
MAEAAAPGRSEVIPNWALEEGVPADVARLREQWGLQGKFVVGYSGNMGRAHRLDAVIDAAERLREDPRVAFLLVGDGAQRAPLERRARELQLQNVVFQPFQPRERLRETLSLPEMHLVSLDARLEGLIVPSKFVGVIALGKPVIWLGEPHGELGAIVQRSGCGIAVAADDPVELAAGIASLAGDTQRLATLQAGATALWANRYQRQRALDRWLDVLRDMR